MLAWTRHGDFRQQVASSVILTLTPQTWTHWAFISAVTLCIKAKGYIKVQVICTCM